jgi:hypothetical protein
MSVDTLPTRTVVSSVGLAPGDLVTELVRVPDVPGLRTDRKVMITSIEQDGVIYQGVTCQVYRVTGNEIQNGQVKRQVRWVAAPRRVWSTFRIADVSY